MEVVMAGRRFNRLAAFGFVVLTGGLYVACGESPASTLADEAAIAQARVGTPASVNQQLAELRRATAHFHDFELADDAEYTFLFMDMCMVDESPAQLGGMGYHYVNLGLLDGEVAVATPEALLYEAGPNGRLRLVAVEYVIPGDAWAGQDPPVLFGQEFTLNAFDLWALHVWVWKHNPRGMFADWNPTVSCG
jgi:hypothetical protein